MIEQRHEELAAWRATFVELERRLRALLPDAEPAAPAEAAAPPVAVAVLAERFGLSRFDQHVLVLAIAPECEPRIAALCERLGGQVWPTADLAIATSGLPGSDPAALRALERLLPDAPLVRAHLVELQGAGPLSTRALRVPDEVWPRLVGLDSSPPADLCASSVPLVRRFDDAWTAVLERLVAWFGDAGGPPLVAIDAPSAAEAAVFAGELAARIDRPLLRVTPPEQPRLAARVAREATWQRALVLVEGAHAPFVSALAETTDAPIAVLDRGWSLLRSTRPAVVVRLADSGDQQRAGWWDELLPEAERGAALDLSRVAATFHYSPDRIALAIELARSASRLDKACGISGVRIAEACRQLAAPVTNQLATPIATDRTREELVVPAATWRELELALAWGRHARVVAQQSRMPHGGGPVCLFHGPSGTGKTLAAQVLAKELGQELVRVDLSQVVNKYIGETEKNLHRLFEEAAASHVILLFDEADALFGRRTEVATANDRYANLETAFLLQRLENHRGPVVLATNLLVNLDAAFLRRIQILAEFPRPGASDRLRIWELHLPDARDRDVDLDHLARRFELAGGEIRNAAFAAGLLAASDGSLVAMRHLVTGLHRELTKLGRLIDPASFGRWASLVVPLARDQRQARGR